jgi:putative transposase
MPTHIYLLIKPPNKPNLSVIMQWIKLHSALYWNKVHGSTDHLWGQRFFARAVKDQAEYDFVMDYIDRNAVVVGLAPTPRHGCRWNNAFGVCLQTPRLRIGMEADF